MPWITTKEAATRSGLYIRTVRRLCRSGAIVAKKLSNRVWLVDADEVDGLRDRHVAEALRAGREPNPVS